LPFSDIVTTIPNTPGNEKRGNNEYQIIPNMRFEAMSRMLNIDHLTKRFAAKTIINDLVLSINEGEIFGLLGPNGAGKTTLIRMLVGLVKPTSGKITLFDQYHPEAKQLRRHIGYMPQQLAVYPGLSVLENVLFFGRMYDVDEARLKKSAIEILEKVELTHRLDSLVSTLSGGMIRRVMLATALIHHPRLLILDEPTAGVDPLLRIKFWEWFNDLIEDGISIIITTHNISEASHCQQVVFLREGNLLEQGTPDKLMQKYNVSNLESAFVSATINTGSSQNAT